MPLNQLLEKRNKIEYTDGYHIMRFYSAFVAISKGKVVDINGPFLEFCPLVKELYGDIDCPANIKDIVKEFVEKKISEFGFFTPKRKLNYQEIAVPFGASEMLMYALRKKIIDAAAIVCDGAGSVIATRPEIVQGIGARMNGLFFTSPISEITEKLTKANCHVVFPDARIDQAKATKEACKMGYRNIAVTINGYMEEECLFKIKGLEQQYNANIISLIICTTGVSEKRINEIVEYGDIVWSCASEGIRKSVGKKAILQISEKIPIFVLTQKGLNFISAYSNRPEIIQRLKSGKQYLLSRSINGEKIKMGDFETHLSIVNLPVRSKREPRFAGGNKHEDDH